MHFPRYWALGTSGEISCWQWSDSSAADAKARADSSAAKIAAARANTADRRNRYDYGQRALREPIIKELPSPNEELKALITRNSYGALVLNTSKVCFVDIDLPPEKESGGKGFFASLFGGKAKGPPPKGAAEIAIERLSGWFDKNPSWGGKLYRTSGGLRLLITSRLLDPNSSETEQIFGELGSDPLYCRLCKNQSSFRARLTPKPWRCDLEVPPARWPFKDQAEEQRFQSWNDRYQAAAQGYATCKIMQSLGNSSVLPDIEQIVSLHDEQTGALSNLPLA